MPQAPDIPAEFLYESTSHQETHRIGALLGNRLLSGTVVCLFGELGSGKTCLVQGIAEGLGISDRGITSPTYTLLNEYRGRIPLYHLDLYRMGRIQDLRALGMEEILYGRGVTVVEWAEQLGDQVPDERIEVRLIWKGPTDRRVAFMGFGEKMALIVEGLKDELR